MSQTKDLSTVDFFREIQKTIRRIHNIKDDLQNSHKAFRILGYGTLDETKQVDDSDREAFFQLIRAVEQLEQRINDVKNLPLINSE